MGNLARQNGVGFFSWIVILLGILCLIMLVVRIVPVYIDHYHITSVLASLQDDAKKIVNNDIDTRLRIDQELRKRLEMEGVNGLSSDNIKVTAELGYFTAEVNYEPQVRLVGNIDLVFHFNDSVQLEK